MKLELNSLNLKIAKDEFLHDEIFQKIILPRLKIILNIKKELKSISKLYWSFEYNSFNRENNKINIKVKNQNPDLNFNYQIPLRQSFEMRLFLANSSVHFIDIYNFIINKRYIPKDKYPLRAQYRTLPHLILNNTTKRYDISVLNSIETIETIIDNNLLECIKNSLEETLETLEKTIINFKS